MTRQDHQKLSRRERQIMDILYECGRASAAEVHERLPDAPGYSAVRAMLAKLEAKGQIRHTQDGPRYLYHAVLPSRDAQQRALHRLLKVFFDDSPAKAANALLDSYPQLSPEELDELKRAIDDARKRGQ